MATFKKVRIGDIISNRFRNFDLHPMSKAHVKGLVESYDKADDFGVIPVRELDDGTYEQAAGHHRLEAMKELGFTHADCKVLDAEDYDMVRIMVNENNTQQGNVNPAKLDSINAIMGQVAYAILLSDTVEDFYECIGVEFYPKGVELRQNGLATAKTRIAKGEPVPHAWLKVFDGDVVGSQTQVSELCNQLKEGGFLEATYAAVQEEIDEITAAQEEEERLQEEARKKAEAKAERERIAAEKAAKEAKERAAKAKASAKAAAEARAKEAERIAKARAAARAEEAKRRQAEREEAEEARERREAAKRVAREAAKAAKDMEKGLHPDVLHMLKASSHQAAFRKLMQGDAMKKVFPVEKQPDLVRSMFTYYGGEEELTPDKIKEYVKAELLRKNAELRRMLEEHEARQAKRSVANKVHRILDDFRAKGNGTGIALQKMVTLLDDEATRDYTLGEIASDRKLAEMIGFLERMILSLRQNLNLRQSQYNQTTIDAANERRELRSTVVDVQ